jgi:hypothetical protein
LTLPKVEAVVAVDDADVAANPARYEPLPMLIATADAGTLVQVVPFADV